MDLMYGIISIVSLILVAGQVQSQDKEYVQGCGGSRTHYCVPRHLCKVKIEFRMASEIRNLGCVSTALCCPKNQINNGPPLVRVEPMVNPPCGFINRNGVTFSISGDTTLAQEAEIPWMVALLDATTRNYVAGGSLISPHVVITGRQRIENMNADQLVVRAGEWDFMTTTEQLPHVDVPIRSIVRHSGFNSTTGAYNVALVFLRTTLDKSRHINPVCMPTAIENIDFRSCIFTGWGKQSFYDSNFMNVMKKVSLPVVPNDICQNQLRKFFGSDFVLDNSLMCAGGQPGMDSCYGDGGSPLACPMLSNPDSYALAGIVNFGIDCGLPNVPGVYTSVANVLEWIGTETQNVPMPAEREKVPYTKTIIFDGSQYNQYNQPNYNPTGSPSKLADSSFDTKQPIPYVPAENGLPIEYRKYDNNQKNIKPARQDIDVFFSTTMEYDFDN
ncbi:phenoloxidase-activating factor 2 [Drosophila erecta]|uniref:Peptidase S1 domain-containing protein n=1 Tax=Drosophila erecta TaxID=7220 RepID=B3N607_DROER|nr:phenoloxidase-activating factor 2 [Drosophila erecta]EDV58045.1 uncharacterized protein Dere_GG25170 [Drosophila erecta]